MQLKVDPNLSSFGSVVFTPQESWSCFCTGRGPDGMCNCERKRKAIGGQEPIRDMWKPAKPRIRVKAGSKRW